MTDTLPPMTWDQTRPPEASEVYRYLILHAHNDAVAKWWEEYYNQLFKSFDQAAQLGGALLAIRTILQYDGAVNVDALITTIDMWLATVAP